MTVARSVMRFARRLAYLLQSGRRQDELREELAFHRQQLAAEMARQGLDGKAVRRAMGNETARREESADVWLTPRVDALLKDCRHAWRALRRAPVFTAVVVLTLAVGIGANTAIFSVVHHLLLAPLPYADGNRIVRLGTESASDPGFPFNVPSGALVRLERRSRALEDFAAGGFITATLGDTANHDVVPGAWITPSLFHTLRIRAAQGRAFTAEDARPDAAPVAMIGYGSWQSRFAGVRDVVGRTITVNGIPRTIVGVTPRGFTLPMRNDDRPEVWLPLDLAAQDAAFDGYARLRPGATTAAARRELQSALDETPNRQRIKSASASVTRAVDRVDAKLKRAVVVLFAAVSGLLLIACANIANLLFMRGWTRQRELAIRRALGGGRGRVARLLLIESSTLAVLGGALGLVIAWKGLSVILGLVPSGLWETTGGPEVSEARIRGGVLAFTTIATIVTSLLFGVGPAFLSTAESSFDAIRTGIRSSTGSAAARRLRSGIVVGQIALSFVFLVAAALLVKSFVAFTRVDVGFQPRGLAIASIDVKRKLDRPERASMERLLAAAMAAVPGVRGAAFGGAILQTDIRGGPFVIDGSKGPETLDLDMCEMPFVSVDYFHVMGIPILRGRSFESDDDLVVNQKLARRFWPNGNALGARLRVGNGADSRWLTVVGIAGDIHLPGGSELFTMQMYRPTAVAGSVVKVISFRATGSPETLEPAIKRAIGGAGAAATLVSVRGVESVLDSRVFARPRFALVLFGVFAAIALLLTAVGLYAIIAYAVTQRTREIGVRVALGADSMAVSRMILGDGIRHLAGGIVLGLLVALPTSHVLASFIYDHDASDPNAFAGAAILLAAVTLVASSVPLRRALGVAPIDALRSD